LVKEGRRGRERARKGGRGTRSTAEPALKRLPAPRLTIDPARRTSKRRSRTTLHRRSPRRPRRHTRAAAAAAPATFGPRRRPARPRATPRSSPQRCARLRRPSCGGGGQGGGGEALGAGEGDARRGHPGQDCRGGGEAAGHAAEGISDRREGRRRLRGNDHMAWVEVDRRCRVAGPDFHGV
jgi:hypothetical protein